MMINKTTEYWNYRQPLQAGPERAPRFLRRDTTTAKGADVVDISDAARRRMLEKNSTPLVKSIMSFSREIGEMVRTSEKDYDNNRAARIEALHRRVREGSYDFEDGSTMEATASSLMARMNSRKNSPDCA
ncbi:MAG: hypothetical protein KA369_14370 [Spirochaetes bacterium]|nr:hypothetical protein [Spirochaetota bacterium]